MGDYGGVPSEARPRLRVGLLLPTMAPSGARAADAALVLDAARRAEAAGFDGVYAGDHLAGPRPMLECLVVLAAVAATTRRLAVGSCVLLAGLRQPAVLARQLTALAALAPGRLRIGVGTGGDYPADFAEVGVSMTGRGARTAAAVARIRELPGEIPVLLGGAAPRALRRAGAIGDGWIGYLHTPAGFARRRADLLRSLTAAGRSTAGFATGMVLPVFLGPRYQPPDGPCGSPVLAADSPTGLLGALAPYREAGCTELILRMADDGPGYQGQLDAIGADVLPALQSLP
jgi:alkanesulfonate monooxygenase SsuD/methylene tetrahydromethanopterin reductase-like flavin-dependent oxidoreductase (luciferase family)